MLLFAFYEKEKYYDSEKVATINNLYVFYLLRRQLMVCFQKLYAFVHNPYRTGRPRISWHSNGGVSSGFNWTVNEFHIHLKDIRNTCMTRLLQV